MVEEYGFHGYVQSDCGAVNNMWQGEQWVNNATEAAARALTDGLMNSNCGGGLVDNICPAIAEGLASEADLDARITRSLTLLMRAGLFDAPEKQTYTQIPFSAINSDHTVALSLSAAAQVELQTRIFLFKNEINFALLFSVTRAASEPGQHFAVQSKGRHACSTHRSSRTHDHGAGWQLFRRRRPWFMCRPRGMFLSVFLNAILVISLTHTL
jgi:beta-glucosidase-like glycosyl hydrolase